MNLPPQKGNSGHQDSARNLYEFIDPSPIFWMGFPTFPLQAPFKLGFSIATDDQKVAAIFVA